MKKIIKPKVDDKRMWDTWMSRYELATVSVADNLAIFEYIGRKVVTLGNISKKLSLSERAVEVVTEVLCGLGFLIKRKKTFSLTPTAKLYLLPDSIFYWGALLQGFHNSVEYNQIIKAIETDKEQLSYDSKTITSMWEEGEVDPVIASRFTKIMHATIFAPAVAAINSGKFGSTKKLLDLGGGSEPVNKIV